MKCASVALAVVAFLIGLRAAHLWYKASKVQIIPMWVKAGQIEPVDIDQAQQHWIVAMLQTAQKSGELNRQAAIWTAWAVATSTASTITGSFA